MRELKILDGEPKENYFLKLFDEGAYGISLRFADQLGKPVTGGCVAVVKDGMLRLIVGINVEKFGKYIKLDAIGQIRLKDD